MFNKKEYDKQYTKKWRADHPEKVREHNKKYKELHKKEIKISHKKWLTAHKEEAKIYDKKYKELRKNILRALSLEIKSKGCNKCGYKDNMRKLLFHHVDPSTKEFNIADLWNRTIKQHKEELDKCVVLCFKCHAAVHKEMEKP